MNRRELLTRLTTAALAATVLPQLGKSAQYPDMAVMKACAASCAACAQACEAMITAA